MTLYVIMNDNPAKSTSKELDRIDKPMPQAAAAQYWNQHRDAWFQRAQDAEEGSIQEEKDYTRKKRDQWVEDMQNRTLWVGTGDLASFIEIDLRGGSLNRNRE